MTRLFFFFFFFLVKCTVARLLLFPGLVIVTFIIFKKILLFSTMNCDVDYFMVFDILF